MGVNMYYMTIQMYLPIAGFADVKADPILNNTWVEQTCGVDVYLGKANWTQSWGFDTYASPNPGIIKFLTALIFRQFN